MTDITIRDLIIYYTTKANVLKSCATYDIKNQKRKEELLKISEEYSDRALQLSEISRFIGKSSTTEINILDNYEAEEKVRKVNFKEKYGLEEEN